MTDSTNCKHHYLDYGRGRAKCQFCGKYYDFEEHCKSCVLDVDNKCIAKDGCVVANKARKILNDIRLLIKKLKCQNEAKNE